MHADHASDINPGPAVLQQIQNLTHPMNAESNVLELAPNSNTAPQGRQRNQKLIVSAVT
jgi:hypothetical protein